MRLLSTTLIAVILMLAAVPLAGRAFAAPSTPLAPSQGATYQQRPAVDDHDESRVTIQLIVAGIAAGVVVVVGSGAYLLRKKLGLVAPPPAPGASGHH